jgi:methylphosphotriester-DNA--protein-cysteine methyltransferase
MIISPDDLGTCPTCNDLNNSQSADGSFFCRRCTPDARQRYERTMRILELKRKIEERKTWVSKKNI